MSQTVRESGRDASYPLLAVDDLQTAFFTDKETIRAVDGISFDIDRGETVGIVGESGSGKSVTARSIMGLVDQPGRILEGSSIKYSKAETVERFARKYPNRTVEVDRGEEIPADADGFIALADAEGSGSDVTVESGYVDLARAPDEAVHDIRGGDIAMVFQDPLSSLNPVYTVGNQIKESLRLHQDLRGQEATEEAAELLEAVGIPDANRRLKEYPHQFSGGMRQRAVIATALACDPDLLICDEPTTALDVTIQAQILDLLKELQVERDIGIMFITHDMGVIAEISDRVNVMYAGEVVEKAPVEEMFENPRHPYTEGLLNSIPGRNPDADRLTTIEGDVPTPNEPAADCRFAPRCPKVFDECTKVHPEHVSVGRDSEHHTAACLLYPEDVSRAEAVDEHERLGDDPEVTTDE
ncbi:ABC transporter ATP-binding protein [Halostella litorea]|uniref:ABC transporter ATP-binding protein n=1 Tax=Halostella litorea TaxID=2528831 RepID=UPI0010926EEA|nr:ABC transporter ATP-binding protein [Halostella litorea]